MVKRKLWWHKFSQKVLFWTAALALMVTVSNVRTCCWFILGQEALPDGAEKFRRK